MDIVLSIVIGLLVFGITYNVGAALFFRFRWYTLGWRPPIYDKKAIEMASKSISDQVIAQLEEECKKYEQKLTNDDRTKERERIRGVCEDVISAYSIAWTNRQSGVMT